MRFDPSSLKIETKHVNIGSLVEMLEKHEIILTPYWKKWDGVKTCHFMESILLGLPIGEFVLYFDQGKGKYVVVDGIQRLNCLNDFIVRNAFSLGSFEFLKEERYNKKFEDMDYFDQLSIKSYPATVHILNVNIPKRLLKQIFHRYDADRF